MGRDGRYELHTLIGQGARGAVYCAVDLKRRLPVVIKFFETAIATTALAKYAETSAAIKRAGIAAALTPYDVVVTQAPGPFAVFTVQAGDTLESQLNADACKWARAVEIVASCAETLVAVQVATGEIHGDLKPSNVWITKKGDTLVMDLGTAGFGPFGPVRRGAELVEYRAPEQLEGTPGDARADVFSLGVLLVELTTGIHPFAGMTAFQAAHKLTQTPPDLAEVTRGMSVGGAREVIKLVTRALASRPDERHVDVRAFGAALAYVRGIVGAPAMSLPRRAAALPPPRPPASPVADPTTIQRLPNLRQLFKHMSAPPPPSAASADPSRAEPATLEQPPPTPLALVAAQMPPLSRPVLADSIERDVRRPVDDHATQALPRILRSPTPANYERATVPVSADRTERDIRHHVHGDATQALPRLIRSPMSDDYKMATVTVPADRTERDIRPRVDGDATQALPRPVHKPAPATDEMATVSLPRRVTMPHPTPETTMLLLETSTQVKPISDPERSDLVAQASSSTGPGEPPAPTTKPVFRPPSARLQWIVIGLNLCVVLALVVLALAVIW